MGTPEIESLGKLEEVKAITALQKNRDLVKETAKLQRQWCRERMTTERWLDENEREWYALDRLVRSRPWATRKDTPLKYPFREATERMRVTDGPWIGDDEPRVGDTRSSDAPCDVITQMYVPPEFPPDHRVLLFTPEFGNDTSFEREAWSYLEPEKKVDVWIACWQGWTDFGSMIEQVTRRVASFADGVSTVFFGQGMGAVVAYEVIKRIQDMKMQTPNLPVCLVVSDCPAPHLFTEKYKPYLMEGWTEKLLAPSISEQQRNLITMDTGLMLFYDYAHDENRRLHIPIVSFYHDGEASLYDTPAVQAWSSYAKDDHCEVIKLGYAEVLDEYLLGHGYAYHVDPAVLATLSISCRKFDRWLTDGVFPDIGPTDFELPDHIDCLVVGAGIAGLCTGREVSTERMSVLVIERHDSIGGVWNYYGNDYSRVNTSEVGYRFVEQGGEWRRPNEDHTPKRDIMKDMHEIAAKHLYGKIRCNTEVRKVEKNQDGTFQVLVRGVKDGVEKSIHANFVSIHVNRRIGKRRDVDWPGSENFGGKVFYGYGNEVIGTDFFGKKVLIVGAGAFAFENVRTAVEHGARHVTLMGRRSGTTCPKWIDMIAFLRPLGDDMMPNKAGNMVSFEAWQNCYHDAGLVTPECWKEGLLKPNNHTISVSDLAFIAGYHGMFELRVGEIKQFSRNGLGVDLKDGSVIDCDILIKCTGFHLNSDVESLTGYGKMQPYGLLDMNLNYGAEPLLDGAQFGGSKDKQEVQVDLGFTDEEVMTGFYTLQQLGFTDDLLGAQGNPFGSGQGGPLRQSSKFYTWLITHQEEQKALLKASGNPEQNVTTLWASVIGQLTHITMLRAVAGLSKLAALTS